jgi:3,4-dihydroxy 2-butanone 4-phosphate synthase / GTP cyclohydrolase II
LRTLADPGTGPQDLTRPGHVAPLVAHPDGVLGRAGHTEAGVDLMRLAGLAPVAALVEVVHDDGSLVRLAEWPAFRRRHRLPDLPVLTIAELAAYRRQSETLVTRAGAADLPTSHGQFRVYAYRHLISGAEHLALVMGRPPTVRWSGCTPNAAPATPWAHCAATAAPSSRWPCPRSPPTATAS